MFLLGDVAQLRATLQERLDIVIAMGLFHHLDDDSVTNLCAAASSLLKEGGRSMSVNPVITEGQSPIVGWLMRMDRGLNVRTESNLVRLAIPYFSTVQAVVRNDLLQVPYTHVILECRR